MPKYIEVTQDGCARLIRGVSPSDIEGIYTDGLLSCIAIIIVGSNGIALIHDTGALSVASVLREFDSVGRVIYWTLAVNTKYYCNENEKKWLEIFARFIEQLEEKIGRDKHLKISSTDNHIKYYEAKKTFVSVTKEGRINVDTRPLDTLLPRNVDERHHLINVVNNYFLDAHEEIDIDVQFDGANFTNMPQLKRTIEEVNRLSTKPRFYNRNGLGRVLDTHRSATTLVRLLNKYKSSGDLLPSLPDAILAAANSSSEDHMTLRKMQQNIETIKFMDEIFPKYGLRGVPDSERIDNALVQARAANHTRDVRFLESQKERLEAVLGRYKGDDVQLPEFEVALRRAAHEKDLEDVQFLIGRVRDINAQDNNPEKRRTALHWAVLKGRKENVEALLAAGARDDIPDATEKTAKDYAMQSSDEEMKSLFQSSAPRIKR